MMRERTRHLPPSYTDFKKTKSLTLHSHGCFRASLIKDVRLLPLLFLPLLLPPLLLLLLLLLFSIKHFLIDIWLSLCYRAFCVSVGDYRLPVTQFNFWLIHLTGRNRIFI